MGSSTTGITTALINSKLNAADPTIVDGPSYPAGSPRVYIASITESKISGADDPKAIKERFAIVAFQTGTSTKYYFSPFLSYTSIRFVDDVITSIASMKRSAIMAIPRNNHIRKINIVTLRRFIGNNYIPGIEIIPLKH